MLIYKATNKSNGKIYIGQTKHTLQKRKRQHEISAKNKSTNTIFHKAIRKYGIDGFMWEILEKNVSYHDLDKLENEYIMSNNTLYGNGYNMTTGGRKGIFHDIDIDKIISLRDNDGLSLEKIAKIFNVSRGTIRSRLESVGHSTKRVVPKINIEEINEYKLSGMSWKEISNKLNIERNYLRKILIEMGEYTDNRKSVDELNPDIIVNYRNKGYSYQKIANIMGANKKTIRKCLVKNKRL
jgi:group I intron endonuclease